jgi:hypothetical protein
MMPEFASHSESLAAEIKMLRTQRRTPTLDSRDIVRWGAAINLLLQRGEFEAAAHGARTLLASKPSLTAAQSLCRILEVLPPPDRRSPPFVDDPKKEVQVVRRAGADTAVLVFADVNHFVGIPFAMAHRWFGRLDASVIYLRDSSNLCFLAGIGSLGSNRLATLARLREVLGTVGARRIVCYGNSVGGFAAIQYAVELGADAVVSMAGPTDLTTLKSPWTKKLKQASKVKNLRSILLEASRPPQVLMLCGENNWNDRLQTDNIADLPCVTVRLLEQYEGHTIAVELICRQQFGLVGEWLVMAKPEAPTDIAPLKFEPWRVSMSRSRCSNR